MIFLVLVINTFIVGATNIDSLKKELYNTNKPKVKYEQYTTIGQYYYKLHKYDSALYYYEQPLLLNINEAERLNCLIKIGNIYNDSTNYKLALNYLEKALELNQKVDNTSQYPVIYNLIGMGNGLSNNLEKSIDAFKAALKYNQELNDTIEVGYSYYNIGLANFFLGRYDLAFEFYMKSAEIRSSYGDTTLLITSYISLGEVLRIKEEYTKAEVYYKQALQLKSKITSKETRAYLYSELALIQKNKKNYNQAFDYIDSAMYYSKEINYKRGIATLLSYKAGIEQQLGNIDTSYVLYQKTIDLYTTIGFEPGIIQSKIALAEILFDRNRLPEVNLILNEIKPLSINNHLLDETTQISKLKYKTYKAQKKYAQALVELENFLVLNDSLFNLNREEKISEIETKYQTEQKEKRIELLDKENKLKAQRISIQKYIVLSLIALMLLIISVLILFFKRKRTLAELELEKNRQKLLQAQMNPHFIYNSLSAIQNYILKNKPLDSVTYISEFSSLTRLVLEGVRSDFVILNDDIKLVKNYLKLQQLRFDNSFEFLVVVDEGINTELVQIPPMLSQPFIENAVEHGMRKIDSKNGKITLSYKQEEKDLIITISDNGPGIEATSMKKDGQHKSLATKITFERIENIRKSYRINITFKVNSNNEGTHVKFIIPQNKN